MPSTLDAAIVVAQHRGPEASPRGLRDLLSAACSWEVCEADDKDDLRRGVVYLAPPDYHLLVEGAHLALSLDAPASFARPSIDVLLESAADAYLDRCVGVILTGANGDGAHGLARVAELGGATIVQDPSEAERAEMPTAALAAVGDALAARLAEIPALLVDLCAASRAAGS